MSTTEESTAQAPVVSTRDGRDIPADVRRTLRKEVGFMCPIDGCGSPYLSWHHFDPPWRAGHSHDPTGMIALCLHHHKQADHGAYSADELRRYKTQTSETKPSGRFAFKLPDIVISAGSSIAASTPTILVINDEPVIWLTADLDGNQMLNIDLLSADGSLAFSMRDNQWEAVSSIEDIECPPSAKSLILLAPSMGIRLSIKFSRVSMHTLRALIASLQDEQQMPDLIWDSMRASFTSEEVTHIALQARLAHPREVIISERQITYENVVIRGGGSIGGMSAFALKIQGV